MSPKASDLAARMAASAAGSRRHVEPGRPQPTASESGPTPRTPDIVRIMVKMPKAQHRFIRQFALDSDSDVSTIVRTLLSRIETDPVFAEEVRSLLHEQR
jgi:hypothetical protein